jgi:two-component system, chemotaxis family, sensor kinase CheA
MIEYSMLQDFITEAGEHLDEMETDLLQLEVEPENQEILNDIFREVHSVKGAADYVGLEKMSRLSHKLENLLEIIRQGKIAVDNRVIDILIEAKDRMALLNKDLESNKAENTEVQDIILRIQKFSGDDEEDKAQENKGQASDNISGYDSDMLQPDSEDIRHDEKAANDNDDVGIEIKADENYDEEHDAELFEIFIEQLKENISLIHGKVAELNQSGNPYSLLNKISGHIESLRSSANYMGYERLVGIYVNWEDEIKETLENISLGKRVSFQFMEDYLEMIFVRFPKVREALRESAFLSTEECLRKCSEKNDEQDHSDDIDFLAVVEKEFGLIKQEVAKEQESGEDFNKDEQIIPDNLNRLDDDEDVEEVDLLELEDLDDNQKLYRNLETAFDKALKNNSKTVLKDDVEESLFSFSIPEPDELILLGPEQKMENSSEGSVSEPEDTSSKARVDHENDDYLPFEDDIGQFDNPETEKDIHDENVKIEKSEFQENDLYDAAQEVVSRRQNETSGDRLVKKTLRVDSQKIDALMNQVGELVISRAWFSQLFNEMKEFQQYLKESTRLEKKEMKQVRNLTFRLSEATVNLGRVANELQEGIMKVRMLPISHLFNKYPRLVRDLIRGTDKKVNLEIKGDETELDKMIIEEISDPLVHTIRNAVDHGIESAEKRKSLGKPEIGTVTLEAYHESNHVVIEIKDDGQGIDPEKIKNTALEKGFATREELEHMNRKEIIALIMRPGFSTKMRVTHTSGRGVGLDVVKKNLERLNGSIEIDSKPGKHTQIRIKIPLTLAIIPALLVKVGKDLFTIPLANVEETLRISIDETTTIEGVEVIHLRKSTLPLVRLSEIFGIKLSASNSGNEFIVVVSTGLRRAGLVVDSLIGQEEVVIKPLVDYLQENSGFSGATILGDGRISLILDIYELVNLTINYRTRILTDSPLLFSNPKLYQGQMGYYAEKVEPL